MRSLHVAALPFPTQQGTPAAIHAMLSALHGAGQSPELLCYAHGGSADAPAYPVHRPERSLGVTSLRSGPSLPKLALDVLLARKLRMLVKTRRPAWVVAHHVEAALACIAAGIPRFAFVAHTSLAAELRCYFPQRLGPLCVRAGASLDRFLCRRATHALAISPLLAQLIERDSGVRVHPIQLPWPVPRPELASERALSRQALGFAAEDEIVLYAGNLDAYQGLWVLVESMRLLARERPRVRILVASPASSQELARVGFCARQVLHVPLASEDDRRRVHAAADVVAVPRESPGGLPIKLLDALARGAQVVAAERAAAGLALSGVCTLVENDNPQAFARALAEQLRTRDRGAVHDARAYVERGHNDARFLADFARILGPA